MKKIILMVLASIILFLVTYEPKIYIGTEKKAV